MSDIASFCGTGEGVTHWSGCRCEQKRIRDEALEEAIAACDALDSDFGVGNDLDKCADAIRALKGKPVSSDRSFPEIVARLAELGAGMTFEERLAALKTVEQRLIGTEAGRIAADMIAKLEKGQP